MSIFFLLALLLCTQKVTAGEVKRVAASVEANFIGDDRGGDRSGGISPDIVKDDYGVIKALEIGDCKALKKGLDSFKSVWDKDRKPIDRTMSDEVVDPITKKSMSLMEFALLNTSLERRAFRDYPKTISILLVTRMKKDGQGPYEHFRILMDADQRKAFPAFVVEYDKVYGKGAYQKSLEEEREAQKKRLERSRISCTVDEDSGRIMA